jgi:hypothetical protein
MLLCEKYASSDLTTTTTAATTRSGATVRTTNMVQPFNSLGLHGYFILPHYRVFFDIW